MRVAAIYSVGLHDMSRHMQPFMSAYPHAKILLECLHPHKVVEAVQNDEADLGVLSYPTATRAHRDPAAHAPSRWCWWRTPPTDSPAAGR